MKSSIVIPARLDSNRLPRKLLLDICGRPMLWHVWNQAKQVKSSDEIIVATDSKEILNRVEDWGGQSILTSPACSSGTERIASILDELDADFILNVQGDQPLVDPALLDAILGQWQASPSDLITPVFQLKSVEELLNPNIVKVARAVDGRALYFSRSPVPYARDIPQSEWLDYYSFWGHIGVYGYRRDVLSEYANLPVSDLEQIEKLEQLRFLDAGYEIQTVETKYQSISVDTEGDLIRVRKIIDEQNRDD